MARERVELQNFRGRDYDAIEAKVLATVSWRGIKSCKIIVFDNDGGKLKHLNVVDVFSSPISVIAKSKRHPAHSLNLCAYLTVLRSIRGYQAEGCSLSRSVFIEGY